VRGSKQRGEEYQKKRDCGGSDHCFETAWIVVDVGASAGPTIWRSQLRPRLDHPEDQVEPSGIYRRISLASPIDTQVRELSRNRDK